MGVNACNTWATTEARRLGTGAVATGACHGPLPSAGDHAPAMRIRPAIEEASGGGARMAVGVASDAAERSLATMAEVDRTAAGATVAGAGPREGRRGAMADVGDAADVGRSARIPRRCRRGDRGRPAGGPRIARIPQREDRAGRGSRKDGPMDRDWSKVGAPLDAGTMAEVNRPFADECAGDEGGFVAGMAEKAAARARRGDARTGARRDAPGRLGRERPSWPTERRDPHVPEAVR